MVYSIVRRHRGTIRVSSEPGCGTAFSMYHPARQAPSASVQAPGTNTPERAPRHVLVVDDEETVRRVLARQLARLGHVAVEAGSGEAALELIATTRFDLICTDLGMPGISGWELIARARAIDSGLRAVLVTGWGEQIDQETARLRGADAVIAKPFDVVRIREVLDAIPPRGGG